MGPSRIYTIIISFTISLFSLITLLTYDSLWENKENTQDNLNFKETLNIDADSPAQFVKDVNGMIWVLASGRIEYDNNWNIVGHTPSALVQLNPNTDLLEKHLWLLT